MSIEENVAGWVAIDHALQNIYGTTEPKHYGTVISYQLGGNDPLDGISVYERQDPIPHWHYITYGFSELYEKETDQIDISGYGFELTFRLAKSPQDTEPPVWALNFLQNLARYVFNSGNIFENGHYLNANGPIALESDTLLHAVAFLYDPELPPIYSPYGRVEFLQVVGITDDEEDAIKSWNCLQFMELLSKYLPLYVTDLSRKSLLSQPDIQKELRLGMQQDGSSTGMLFVNNLDWKEEKGLLGKRSYKISIGARQVKTISQVLQGRISKGRSLQLIGKGVVVSFVPRDEPTIYPKEDGVELSVNQAMLDELISHLVPKESDFTLQTLENVKFQIVKSYITNQQGEVVEVIG